MEIRDYVIHLIKKPTRLMDSHQWKPLRGAYRESAASGRTMKTDIQISQARREIEDRRGKRENDLVDGGLRYDLTVPLARYYANHMSSLPSPFKAMQIEIMEG